ncbi:hypothetical protein C0J52_23589 [Blattella germanica]|nr:hypothetical protein C0J52_23589 [Blattella germanica]
MSRKQKGKEGRRYNPADPNDWKIVQSLLEEVEDDIDDDFDPYSDEEENIIETRNECTDTEQEVDSDDSKTQMNPNYCQLRMFQARRGKGVSNAAVPKTELQNTLADLVDNIFALNMPNKFVLIFIIQVDSDLQFFILYFN